jgi:hypothetical protein
MPSVVILNVILLNVIKLNVVAPTILRAVFWVQQRIGGDSI